MSLVVSIPTMCLLTEGHLDSHSDGEDQRRPLTTWLWLLVKPKRIRWRISPVGSCFKTHILSQMLQVKFPSLLSFKRVHDNWPPQVTKIGPHLLLPQLNHHPGHEVAHHLQCHFGLIHGHHMPGLWWISHRAFLTVPSFGIAEILLIFCRFFVRISCWIRKICIWSHLIDLHEVQTIGRSKFSHLSGTTGSWKICRYIELEMLDAIGTPLKFNVEPRNLRVSVGNASS